MVSISTVNGILLKIAFFTSWIGKMHVHVLMHSAYFGTAHANKLAYFIYLCKRDIFWQCSSCKSCSLWRIACAYYKDCEQLSAFFHYYCNKRAVLWLSGDSCKYPSTANSMCTLTIVRTFTLNLYIYRERDGRREKKRKIE